jgi:hypothetical protein
MYFRDTGPAMSEESTTPGLIKIVTSLTETAAFIYAVPAGGLPSSPDRRIATDEELQ